MAVYNVVSVSTLLYGAETRTSYNATPYDATKTAWRFFTSDVSKKYSACPWKTGWLQLVPSAWKQPRPTGIYAGLATPFACLAIAFHIKRAAGEEKKKCYKDFTKELGGHSNIDPGHLEALAFSRQTWWATHNKTTNKIKNIFIQRRTARRGQWHQQAANTPLTSGHACTTCGRVCGSKIGLHSNMRWHLLPQH